MLSGPCQSLVATNNTAQKLGRANGPNSCAAVSWPKARRGIGSSTPPPIGPRSLATPPTPRFPPASSPHLVPRTPALPQPGPAYPRAPPTWFGVPPRSPHDATLGIHCGRCGLCRRPYARLPSAFFRCHDLLLVAVALVQPPPPSPVAAPPASCGGTPCRRSARRPIRPRPARRRSRRTAPPARPPPTRLHRPRRR